MSRNLTDELQSLLEAGADEDEPRRRARYDVIDGEDDPEDLEDDEYGEVPGDEVEDGPDAGQGRAFDGLTDDDSAYGEPLTDEAEDAAGFADEDDSDLPLDHESPEDLDSEDLPNRAAEPFEDSGKLTKVSPFDQFMTNQLIDYPVEDVAFTKEEEVSYVDAKFGDKAVSFALYKGDEGQPILGILYDDEVYRKELPAEALSGEGEVRDEWMPIDWIRDILSRLVDVAPEFESLKKTGVAKLLRELCGEHKLPLSEGEMTSGKKPRWIEY